VNFQKAEDKHMKSSFVIRETFSFQINNNIIYNATHLTQVPNHYKIK